MQIAKNPRPGLDFILSIILIFIGLSAAAISLFSCAPESKTSQLIAKNNLLIGGIPIDATSDLAASSVAIYFEEDQGICSGTLISNHFVLTAGHCLVKSHRDPSIFPPEHIHLYFGDGLIELKGAQKFQGFRAQATATHVVLHKDFKRGFYRIFNDLALIEFNSSLPESVKPIGLDSLCQLNGKSWLEKIVLTLGFGVTQVGQSSNPAVLRAINLAVNTAEKNSIFELVNPLEGAHATCSGDSGGASFVEINGKRSLWAITSMSDCSRFNYVTAVSDYYDWISRTVEESTNAAL
jgi:secreted trypsin-like serine protease